ncbi:MAG: hemerythrin domain-containing protein [Kiloniellaceae bacterium]
MFQVAEMVSIIDTLRSDHARMTKLLDALERQIGAFGGGGTLDFEIANGILHYCRLYPDRHHHPREDLVFARLQQRNPQTLSAIGDLAAEHRALAALTERFAVSLRAVEQDTPMERHEFVEPAMAFLNGYRRHILMEEKYFFPAAKSSLTPEDWRHLAAQLEDIEDPLFDRREDERFDALYRDIIAWDMNLPAGA